MIRTSVDLAAQKVITGERVSRDEAVELYQRASTHHLGLLANVIRRRKHPEDVVTYIVDRNVNYTNICVAKCNFCAFYREVGAGDGYVLGFDEICAKIDETIELGGVQLLLQGGHNPDLPLGWFEDLFRTVKDRFPQFKLHALSPPEVVHLSRLSELPIRTVVERLIAAGLDSIPGGGHYTRTIKIKENKLYLSVGSSCNVDWAGATISSAPWGRTFVLDPLRLKNH